MSDHVPSVWCTINNSVTFLTNDLPFANFLWRLVRFKQKWVLHIHIYTLFLTPLLRPIKAHEMEIWKRVTTFIVDWTLNNNFVLKVSSQNTWSSLNRHKRFFVTCAFILCIFWFWFLCCCCFFFFCLTLIGAHLNLIESASNLRPGSSSRCEDVCFQLFFLVFLWVSLIVFSCVPSGFCSLWFFDVVFVF